LNRNWEHGVESNKVINSSIRQFVNSPIRRFITLALTSLPDVPFPKRKSSMHSGLG